MNFYHYFPFRFPDARLQLFDIINRMGEASARVSCSSCSSLLAVKLWLLTVLFVVVKSINVMVMHNFI